MGVGAYQFAATAKDAQRTMASYAAMFDEGPVLDLGAGRGYFLEALRARGIDCLGVDINEEAVAQARQIGVDVILEDGFTFIARQSGLGGLFVSHVIEHLVPSRVEELFHAAHRSLRPNGTIVIVTPNPQDWLVLSEIFWLDPTHVRPYPTLLVAAMLETAGFRIEKTGLRRLSVGRRTIPGHILNRIRFGANYGRSEAWIRARRSDTS
jgi:SAM-dependent methyltransferase